MQDAVDSVPLFDGLSRRARRRIGKVATTVHVPYRSVLAAEGAPADRFFVVLDGELEVRKNDTVVATQGPGSHAGAPFLLTQRRRETTLVAATPLQMLVVTDQDFDQLVDRHPEVADRLHAEIGKAALSGASADRAA